VIVANNLASLLSQQAATPEEIERAFAIARRLRTIGEPPFQDTYGWLLYQRGQFEEALGYLEPAAEGLPQDPIVQVHLGMTYLALGRQEEAKAVLSRAVELAGDRDIQQIDLARDALAEIEARPTTDGSAASAGGSVAPDGGSDSGEGAGP
jgi:tetratricopeptide (TPR) repeat protein